MKRNTIAYVLISLIAFASISFLFSSEKEGEIVYSKINYWDSNGKIKNQRITLFKTGFMKYEQYNDKGILIFEGYLNNSTPVNTWISRDDNGNIITKGSYKDGREDEGSFLFWKIEKNEQDLSRPVYSQFCFSPVIVIFQKGHYVKYMNVDSFKVMHLVPALLHGRILLDSDKKGNVLPSNMLSGMGYILGLRRNE